MKKILIILLFAFGIKAKAQITLEHSYDSTSTFLWGSPNQLSIVKFEISGDRYVRISMPTNAISIYDMNHILIKKISLASLPSSLNGTFTILYLSEQLFDTDSKIEFMYIILTAGSPNIYHTMIYNEDGTMLFKGDSLAPLVNVNIPQRQLPIYNTSSSGTKMILSQQFDSTAKVYGLPGILSNAIQEGNGQLMQAQGISNLYPNPSNGKVILQYELPKGEKEGEIILYNTQGAEIKRYKVDDTFNDLFLDNTQLPAGTYFYQLQISKRSIGVKKMIVIK